MNEGGGDGTNSRGPPADERLSGGHRSNPFRNCAATWRNTVARPFICCRAVAEGAQQYYRDIIHLQDERTGERANRLTFLY
jgi:hypothetical protein